MVEDILAIQQLLADYCFRVDTGTGAEVSELFAEDAVMLPVYDGDYRVVGRKDVARWYDHYNDNLRVGVRNLRHVLGLPSIRLNGDRAEANSYFIVDMVPIATGTPIIANGRYDDVLKKEGGRWVFAERVIHVTFTAPYSDASEQFTPMGWPGAPAG
jgi:hypothetical protein